MMKRICNKASIGSVDSIGSISIGSIDSIGSISIIGITDIIGRIKSICKTGGLAELAVLAKNWIMTVMLIMAAIAVLKVGCS